jgi:outer membrane protein assembly factor BamB
LSVTTGNNWINDKMVFFVKNAALALVGLVGLGSVQAQLIYRSVPTQDWEAQVGSVRRGNGVFLSPADDMVVASSSDGSVTAFDSETGTKVRNYTFTWLTISLPI